jgi:hypothetical protein
MKGNPTGKAGMPERTDWRRLRAMTEQEVHAAVVADPDANPTDEAFWKSARLVVPQPKKQMKTPSHVRNARVRRLVADLQLDFRTMVAPRPGRQDGYLHLLVTRLARGTKIEVRMERNHFRPHFHASTPQDCDISIDIVTLEVLAGKCDNKIRKEVEIWAYMDREKLLKLWNELNPQAAYTFPLEA